MGYEILSNTDKNKLEISVRKYLKNDWSLQGGVSVAVDASNNDLHFFQAVTKS